MNGVVRSLLADRPFPLGAHAGVLGGSDWRRDRHARRGESAAIAIGGTVALDAMFGGPVRGASMNPARSLGPALVSGDLTAIWIHLAAPAAGAAMGALVYQYLRGSREAPLELRPPATAEEPA